MIILAEVLLFALLMVGCSSPVVLPVVDHEKMTQIDKSLGIEFAQHLEPKLKLKRDPEVVRYLQAIATHLIEVNSEFDGIHVTIWIVNDHRQKWYNFTLTDNRVFLSASLLKSVEYENEIAAAIGIQLAHLVNKDLIKRLLTEYHKNTRPLSKQKTSYDGTQGWRDVLGEHPSELTVDIPADVKDSTHLDPRVPSHKEFLYQQFALKNVQTVVPNTQYFGPDGLFSFSTPDEVAAIKNAVGILYNAGYDSRGLVSLLGRYRNAKNSSPYDQNMLEDLIDSARREIAIYAPIRSPIVSTSEFMSIQKRMRRL